MKDDPEAFTPPPANDTARPAARSVNTGALHLHANATNVEMDGGDAIFMQRSWLDALAAMPTAKVLTLSIEIGIGLATGVAVFVSTLLIFFSAVDWMRAAVAIDLWG